MTRRPPAGGSKVGATPRRRSIVRAPGGIRDRRRIHLVRDGELINAGFVAEPADVNLNANVVVAPPHHRPPPNWIVSAWTRNTTGTPVTEFKTRFVVPPAPAARASQLIYLFSGMLPVPGTALPTILQPVLQWGDSGPDSDGVNRTGPFWSATSWLVPDARGRVRHKQHIPVAPGNELTGVVSILEQANGLFTYRCEFAELPESRLDVGSMHELAYSVHALEAYDNGGAKTVPYDLDSRAEYPDAPRTHFRDITVRAGGANDALVWNRKIGAAAIGGGGAPFNEDVVIVNASRVGGEVDIVY